MLFGFAKSIALWGIDISHCYDLILTMDPPSPTPKHTHKHTDREKENERETVGALKHMRLDLHL